MTLRSEILAIIFGMLVILIVFGNAAQFDQVGNLDTIFGQSVAGWMDVLYPLSSIVAFLFYGWSKGSIKLHPASILLFLAFLGAILMIQFDDNFVVLKHPITLPEAYWNTARILYFVIAPITFLAFGWQCAQSKSQKRK